MNTYTATVIKTGNSYALRVPKRYIEDAKLELGQKVQVSDPLTAQKAYDPKAVQKAVQGLRHVKAYADIKDPIAWQKTIRTDRALPGRD